MPKITEVSFALPWGIGEVKLEPNTIQRDAAWELYVELATRISAKTEARSGGLVREALASLYTIIDDTRKILRKAGPTVASGPNSFGPIAIEVVNKGLRPFLDVWHARLLDHEQHRPADRTPIEHERDKWEPYYHFWGEALPKFQQDRLAYIEALAKIAGIEHRIETTEYGTAGS